MKKNALNFIAFISLFIVAILVLINNILPILGITIGGILIKVLEIVKDVFFIILIGVTAYRFVSNKAKAWKIIYFIIFTIYIVGSILHFI